MFRLKKPLLLVVLCLLLYCSFTFVIHYFTSPPWSQQNCPLWDNIFFIIFYLSILIFKLSWIELHWTTTLKDRKLSWGGIDPQFVCLPPRLRPSQAPIQPLNQSDAQHHSSGAVWESRWTSWAVRPNEPSGFRGRKDLLHRASALVTTCP